MQTSVADSTPTGPDKQPLNPLDIALHCADQTIRGMGYAGFETQMLVWLSGRLDAAKLRQALVDLSRLRPAIAARLVGEGLSGRERPYWQFQDSPAEPHVVELPSNEPQSILDYAARLLSQSRNLGEGAPLRFYLLRRPGGGDVVLMQYSHVLMDNSASGQLLREIDQLYAGELKAGVAISGEPRNVLHRWLMRLPHAQRRAASRAAIELQGRTMRGRAAIIGTGEEDKPRRVALKIVTRTLPADIASAVYQRSARVCGLPNLSMVILAAAFRAIGRLGPPERNHDRNYIAGIGLDMKQRRQERALLQNLLSVAPVFVQPGQLHDRDELVRNLSGQIRERLRDKVDWGILRLVNGFQRKPRHIRWVVEHLLRWTYSLWYAYFGSLDALGARFCGVPIESAYYIGPTWSPLGVSLLANQFQGRLFLQATYDPELVESQLAEEFSSQVLADLKEFADAS